MPLYSIDSNEWPIRYRNIKMTSVSQALKLPANERATAGQDLSVLLCCLFRISDLQILFQKLDSKVLVSEGLVPSQISCQSEQKCPR